MSKPAHDEGASVRAISRALWAGESPERLVPQLLRLADSAEPATEAWCFAQRHLALAWAPIRPWRASLRARELLSVDPTDHAGWAALGLAQSIIHNHRYAIRCYERALKIAPGQPRYAHNLGHLYDVVLDDPAAAIPLLAAAHDAEPRCSDVAASYAHALARTGEVERALVVLRGALTNGATRDQAELYSFLKREVTKRLGVSP